MASPFAVFRKNQQTLLVLLFILAMFAFIVMDSLSPERLSLPLLGMLLGMIVLTAIGVALKKPMQYAAAGAIGGLLAGYIANWSGLGTPDQSIVAHTSLGDLDQRAINQMMEQRHVANSFISSAVMKALGDENQFALQQAVQQYAFELAGSVEQQTALAMILRNEADKLGIAIDNAAVTSYIRAATQDKLTKEDFKEVLSDMNVSENTLYRIIADELKVKTAWQLLAPASSSSTPARLWENFKKMEVTQSLQVVAVPVDAFGESTAKPSDGELQAFFEQHKNNYPGTPKPEDFGFLQPRKIQLAYLEASYLEVEQLVAEVTDEEIEKYYEDNKDILFLNRQVPDFSRGQLIEPSQNSDIPELFDPSNPSDSEQKPDEDKEQIVPPSPEDTAPDAGKPDSDAPAPENENKEAKPADQPQSEPPQESSPLSSTNSLQTVAFINQEENQESVKPEDKPEKAPADPKESPAESQADPVDAEKPVQKPTVPPEPEAPTKNLPPAPEDPAGEQPLVAEKPQPKYQPLDSSLKDSIRDQLLSDRTRAKQKELIDLVFERMLSLSNEYFAIGTAEFEEKLNKSEADKARLKFIEDARKELRELAKKHSLNYAESPLMSYQEMTESGEHPIGSAVVGDDPAAQGAQMVADKMFRGSPESVYEADRATSLDLNSAFAFWKTADVEAHVPKFEDEGIREQVLEAWVELKSRPLAEQRAKELKSKLEKSEASWSELLAEETITGDEEGQVLSTRPTERFSWMRSRSVPSQFGFNMDRAELSTISAIENADDDFMRVIFDEMNEGEVNVIPNVDRSIYYVVKVVDRQPGDRAAWEAKRDQFLRSDQFMFFSTYAQITGNEQNELVSDWMKSLMDSYDVRFKGSAVP